MASKCLQLAVPFLLLLGNIAGSITRLFAFTSSHSLLYRHERSRRSRFSDPCGRTQSFVCFRNSGSLGVSTSRGEDSVKVGDLLSDLPTPTLLIELSLAESALNHTSMSLDDYLQTAENSAGPRTSSSKTGVLDGSVFIHTKITDTSVRDGINKDKGSGKSPVIGRVDACSREHVPGGAFLGIGLSNHHVGGYYWARGMGIGASLEAHGVAFRDVANEEAAPHSFQENKGGELYWKKRRFDATSTNSSGVFRGATTDESSNSNDGKRSEWADFLVCGDTVQLIPYNTQSVLFESAFERIVGVRRVGRPLGADPIVERVWKRTSLAEGDGKSNPHTWVPL